MQLIGIAKTNPNFWPDFSPIFAAIRGSIQGRGEDYRMSNDSEPSALNRSAGPADEVSAERARGDAGPAFAEVDGEVLPERVPREGGRARPSEVESHAARALVSLR